MRVRVRLFVALRVSCVVVCVRLPCTPIAEASVQDVLHSAAGCALGERLLCANVMHVMMSESPQMAWCVCSVPCCLNVSLPNIAEVLSAFDFAP